MNSVILRVAILLIAATCISAQKTSWDDLRVTFSFGDPSTGFFKLPRTSAAATVLGWTTPPEENNNQYKIMCPSKDPTVCVMYKNGNVNGIEFAMQVKDTTHTSYPFAKHPMYVRRTRFGYDLYIITVFTVKPGTVMPASTKLETGNGVWLDYGPGGVRNFEIPRLQSNMASTKFTLENCIPRMGVHYYYNISEQLSCDDFEPMFGLFQNGELIGLGLQSLGRPTVIGKNWFEPVPPEAIRPTIPKAPQCLVDGVANDGIISLHIYFIDEPYNIKC